MANKSVENADDRPSGFIAAEFFQQVDDTKSELVRKSIHFLIALTPTLASLDKGLATALLALGTLVYAYAEAARLQGFHIPVISTITAIAARSRDQGRFVLGPITLGLGAMLALLLYPDPAASIAIYALAFGDGFAGLIGRLLGRIRPAFLFGKSLEGSSACFIAVLAVTYKVAGDFRLAFFSALTATLVEALPLDDFDNIFLPMSVGLTVEVISRFG